MATAALDPAPIATLAPVPASTPTDRRGDIIAYSLIGLLAYVVTLVFIVVILKIDISAVMMALVVMVVTAVTGGVGVVTGFQFGSSKGSQAKDAQIAAMTPPPAS